MSDKAKKTLGQEIIEGLSELNDDIRNNVTLKNKFVVDDVGLCDSCGEPKDDQEYVGYGMMFCQVCIDEHLIRISDGFRFKTKKEKEQKSDKQLKAERIVSTATDEMHSNRNRTDNMTRLRRIKRQAIRKSPTWKRFR